MAKYVSLDHVQQVIYISQQVIVDEAATLDPKDKTIQDSMQKLLNILGRMYDAIEAGARDIDIK